MMHGFKTLSGNTVNSTIFGTMQFGGTADEQNSESLYSCARNSGITHFDTAYVYTDGASERFLGRFAKQERAEIFIATKVGYTGGAGRKRILEYFDISRQRLKMDVIDLLYLHRFDQETALEETFETLAKLQSDGVIRHIGVSNFAAWQVMKAQAVAQQFGTKIDAVQPMYNLVKRQAEVELLPMCTDQGMIPATYSPLGGGLLTGKYLEGGTGRLTSDDRYAARYSSSWINETAKAFAQLAQEVGMLPTTLAVAWVLKGAYSCHPIISARSAEQLQPSLAAMSYEMSDELYARISALSPTPAPATDRLEEQ